MWKTVLAVWGSTAMAIGIALYYTHNIRCLWFLLIPACMSYRSNDKADVLRTIDKYKGDKE